MDAETKNEIERLKRRIAALEKAPLFVKRSTQRCRWVFDKGERFWIPHCYGGIYGKDTCTCRANQPASDEE
jgi:hypothetical protein